MKNVLTAGAALLLTTSLAQAGGLDRSGNPYSALFEEGNYLQFSFSTVNPDVSGDYPEEVNGGSTENMAESYSSAGVAIKYAVSNQLDLGVFLNQPYGANSTYEEGFYEGLTADWGSNALSVIAKYEVSPGVSVYGGPRIVQSTAEIAIPDQLLRAGVVSSLGEAIGEATVGAIIANAPSDPVDLPAYIGSFDAAIQPALGAIFSPQGSLAYEAETDTNTQVGYVVGAAYEMPEIALRVALTYESGVTHEFQSKESLAIVGADGATGEFEIEMPQSVALDFQSGVAADTLVFGSVRWSEWSKWEVRPEVYEGFTGDRVTGLDNDVFTYQLGVGRVLSDQLSVFGRVTYEAANGGIASRLAPTDGSTSYGIGGSYTMDNVSITGGLEYAVLGDADDGLTEFSDNSALGFGLSVGYNF